MYRTERIPDFVYDEAMELLFLIDKYDPQHQYASQDDIAALGMLVNYWALCEVPEYLSDDYDLVEEAHKICSAGLLAFGETFADIVKQARSKAR